MLNESRHNTVNHDIHTESIDKRAAGLKFHVKRRITDPQKQERQSVCEQEFVICPFSSGEVVEITSGIVFV